MSVKRKEKQRERHKEWAKMYEKYLASGKTVREWCEKTGIAEGTFRSRVKQLKEEKWELEHEIVEVKAEAKEQNRNTENKGMRQITPRSKNKNPSAIEQREKYYLQKSGKIAHGIRESRYLFDGCKPSLGNSVSRCKR